MMIHCLLYVIYHTIKIYICFSKPHNSPNFDNITQKIIYSFKELLEIKGQVKQTFHNNKLNHQSSCDYSKHWNLLNQVAWHLTLSELHLFAWQFKESISIYWKFTMPSIAKYCGYYKWTIYCGSIPWEPNKWFRAIRVKLAKQWKGQHKEM